MSDTSHYLVRWLCHDLATPIASVMTASELLDDTPDAEISELIRHGARRLSARLRLVRLALGAAESALGNAQLQKLVREGLDDTPIDWRFSGDADNGMATLVAGAAMLVADPNRTRALVVGDNGVTVPAGCTWPDAVAAALAGAPASCNRSAVATMLVAAAARAGRTLHADGQGLHWR